MGNVPPAPPPAPLLKEEEKIRKFYVHVQVQLLLLYNLLDSLHPGRKCSGHATILIAVGHALLLIDTELLAPS